MNYLWRHGNAAVPHDILTPDEHFSRHVQEYVRTSFEALSESSQRTRVLDKTAANVLRLPYVQAILPEAKILHIVRDGRAVAASAMLRWQAPQKTTYYMRKAQSVPPWSLPRYALQYVRRKLAATMQGRDHRQSWGPRFPGIDEAVRDLSLAQVCARQWRISVETALATAPQLEHGTYMEIRYEDLVAEPDTAFSAICEFFHLRDNDAVLGWARDKIDASRQSKWRAQLSLEESDQIEREIAPTLERLGYA